MRRKQGGGFLPGKCGSQPSSLRWELPRGGLCSPSTSPAPSRLEAFPGPGRLNLLSFLRYNDLHTFELQDPTRVIEWIGEKSVCVAGYENPRRNEILQLLLPQRLCSKGNQGLCPERDFKVELGGFSDRPVYGLKHVPQTSLLVTSGPPDGALQVWRMEPEETGVIKPVTTIPPSQGDEHSFCMKMATTSSRAARVLHGLKMNNIQMTEVESQKTIFTAGSFSSCRLQKLWVIPRIPFPFSLPSGHPPVHLLDPPKRTVTYLCLSLSAPGPGLPSAPPMRIEFGSRRLCFSRRVEALLAVSFAPLLEDHLAVSGGTCSYETHQWDSATQEAQPTFLHKEHVFGGPGGAREPPLVTAHTWHPSKPRTLLSAASDGSLHVWDWADPQGGATQATGFAP
nr:WD repeat-containing protein 73-like [Pogona vitticeps]